MAQVDVISGEKLLIQIGNGATPEVFAHPCLINTDRGITFSSTTTTDIIPDCSDPAAPAWQQTEKDGLSAQISGSGMLDVASIDDFYDWFISEDPKNVKVRVDKTGGSTWTGSFHLTEFAIQGTRKQKATVSITLVSNGPVSRANNT